MSFPEDYEYDQSPEANMLRRQMREEERRRREDERVVEDLLRSLTPADAVQPLFTFREIKEWGLKHTRKRAKDADG